MTKWSVYRRPFTSESSVESDINTPAGSYIIDVDLMHFRGEYFPFGDPATNFWSEIVNYEVDQASSTSNYEPE